VLFSTLAGVDSVANINKYCLDGGQLHKTS
jgi:hypothetical protein